MDTVRKGLGGRLRSEQDLFDLQSEEDAIRLSPEGALEQAVYQILLNVGEDPDRNGLKDTPQRVARMYTELLGGYSQDLKTIVNGALFDVDYDAGEMVVVGDIPFSSMCEHHMLPFTGKVHVAYIPTDKVLGLSKIPRIVDMFARRLQVQERMTNEIADALAEVVNPAGVMVVVEGQHTCTSVRGVKKDGVTMTTAARRGKFRDDPQLRGEFDRVIGK